MLEALAALGRNKPLKIALTARARAGKDTVADYLVDKYGFVRFAFGDGLRRVCRDLFPAQFENGAKPRALLQGVAQAMRGIDPDVWVNLCMKDVALYPHGNLVIIDLRQPNEYRRLKAEGFIIIRVNASEETRIQRMQSAGDVFNPADVNHETEQYVDTFAVDYELDNNGTLEELYAQIDAIMERLKEGDLK